jgi:hypothetical protein
LSPHRHRNTPIRSLIASPDRRWPRRPAPAATCPS